MIAADQIAEINAQFTERVKLLERERDAKVAMVRERCKHEFGKKLKLGNGVTVECAACGTDLVAIGGKTLFCVKIVDDCGSPIPQT